MMSSRARQLQWVWTLSKRFGSKVPPAKAFGQGPKPRKVSSATVSAVPTQMRPLLCTSKYNEIIEYAYRRIASPALIAEYQTQLPDKALLQAKLHEFYLQNQAAEGEA